MKRKAQALLAAISFAISGAVSANAPPETNGPCLRLPLVGYVNLTVGRPYTRCSRDMKYVASGSVIDETATGRAIAFGTPHQAFFSPGGIPRLVAFDRDRAKATVYELPRYRPVLSISGRRVMWTTVWGKPLRDVPLLIVAASEAEGRVEVWNVESLTRVLEIRDKSFYSDLLQPLYENESLVAAQAGNRLAWLNPQGDAYVWDLQARTGKPTVLSKIGGPRAVLGSTALRIARRIATRGRRVYAAAFCRPAREGRCYHQPGATVRPIDHAHSLPGRCCLIVRIVKVGVVLRAVRPGGRPDLRAVSGLCLRCSQRKVPAELRARDTGERRRIPSLSRPVRAGKRHLVLFLAALRN